MLVGEAGEKKGGEALPFFRQKGGGRASGGQKIKTPSPPPSSLPRRPRLLPVGPHHQDPQPGRLHLVRRPRAGGRDPRCDDRAALWHQPGHHARAPPAPQAGRSDGRDPGGGRVPCAGGGAVLQRVAGEGEQGKEGGDGGGRGDEQREAPRRDKKHDPLPPPPPFPPCPPSHSRTSCAAPSPPPARPPCPPGAPAPCTCATTGATPKSASGWTRWRTRPSCTCRGGSGRRGRRTVRGGGEGGRRGGRRVPQKKGAWSTFASL